MKISISKSDIIWNYIGIIVSLMGNFLLIPFLIKFLSTDYYGLWNVFISLGAVSVLFDFGFNSLFARNIAYSWSGVDQLSKENVRLTQDNRVNYFLLKKVIKTCQLVYLLISSLALLILTTVGLVYIIYVTKSIGNNTIVIISWELYAVGIFLDLLYGYYDAFLRGIGEIGANNRARVISKLVQIILTVLLLFFNFGIISTSIANIVYGLIFRGLCKKSFYNFNNMKTELDKVGEVPLTDTLDTFKIVWHNAWREGVVSIANYVSNQVTTLLCSLYLGLSATAKFGLAVQFTSAVAQVATALLMTYQPLLQESYSHRNFKEIREKLSVGVMAYLFLYPIGMVGLTIFIPVINSIKGSDVLILSLLFYVGIYQYILKFRDCYAWYLGSTNRVIYYKSFIISSIVCTILSVVFVGVFKMGITGFVLAQIISQVGFNSWYWPLYVHKELKLSVKSMLINFKNRLVLSIRSL